MLFLSQPSLMRILPLNLIVFVKFRMGEDNGQRSAVRVICRFRPLNTAEVARGDQALPRFPPDSESVSFCGKTFTFDKVFGPQSSQQQIYDAVASRLVDDVIKGNFEFTRVL